MKLEENKIVTKRTEVSEDYIVNLFKSSQYNMPIYKELFSIRERLIMFIMDRNGMNSHIDVLSWKDNIDSIISKINND